MQVAEDFLQRLVVANATPQLTGDRDLRDDAANDRRTDRPTRFRTVEIDEVQPRRTGFHPAACH